MRELVLGDAHELVWIAEAFKLPDGICREVCLNSNKSVVVSPSETVYLTCEYVFVKAAAENCNLSSFRDRDDLSDETVGTVARGVRSDDVSLVILRFLVYADKAVFRFVKTDVGYVRAVVRECEHAFFQRRRESRDPFADAFGVENA